MNTLREQNAEIIKRVLGDEYLDLRIAQLNLTEDFEGGNSRVEVVTRSAQSKREINVTGEGVGIVDALFSGLLARFAEEYQSLKTIELSGFAVKARIDTKEQGIGSDAVGEVVLEVQNSDRRSFQFSDSSRSIVASAARAVLSAVEYFVNAERAFITLHKALTAARERKRQDLVDQYTRELSEVVKSTSYAEVIERIRQEI